MVEQSEDVDRDALLVRAALDIMRFQSRVARLEDELKTIYRAFAKHRRPSVKTTAPDQVAPLHAVVLRHVLDAYAICDQDVRRTAKTLGVTPPTVYAHLPIQVMRKRRESPRYRLVKKLPASEQRQ